MAIVNKFGRINRNDFAEEDKALVDQLAGTLNNQIDQLSLAFNKNIDINNLKQEYIQLVVTVDVNGIPKIPTKFKNSLTSNLTGISVIKAECTTNLATVPTSHPFLIFNESGRIVTVTNVRGLQPDVSFRLTLNTKA